MDRCWLPTESGGNNLIILTQDTLVAVHAAELLCLAQAFTGTVATVTDWHVNFACLVLPRLDQPLKSVCRNASDALAFHFHNLLL
jgi:hypothetical protein